MVNYIAIIGIGVINFFLFVSFIINLFSHYRNKRFVCYMHLLFWLIFNITIFIVGVLPELNKINVIY